MNINATLIGQMITFFVFVWFSMKFIWPFIIDAMRTRQATIAEGLAASERAAQSLDSAKAQVVAELDAAKLEAARILDQARQRGAAMVEEAQVQAREEGERIKESARAEIDQEVNRAKETLRGQIAKLAVNGAERILETTVDASAHERMLERLAAEL